MTRLTHDQPHHDARVSAEHLASLSHEFRTPLNGVLGMTRLLEGTGLTAEQRAYVAALRESGEHLLGLVNDVLDFAKLGADKIDLHPATMDIEGLLRSVSELLSPRAQEKGLEIAWAAPAGIGQALADEGRLRQILLNFAGNAVKFTKTGGVLLSVSLQAGDRLRFSVADTGPGVSPAARDKIFEAFAQADPTYDGLQLGGAGLGLAIARKLAGAMEGVVGVDDAPGGGAVFWLEAAFPRLNGAVEGALAGRTIGVMSPNAVVAESACRQIGAAGGVAVAGDDRRAEVLLVDHALAPSCPPDSRPAIILLPPDQRARIDSYRALGFAGYLIKPLRRASVAERVLAVLSVEPNRAEGPEDERVAPAIAQGVRVLLVEDNAINALLARTLLSREGCKVDHASGGEEAMAALKIGRYDLILMDMRMPGMSGLEATRALRAAGLDTPIVALTANAFEDDRHACLDAGMNDFLVKPLAPDALRGILARLGRGGWTETAVRAKVS